MIQGREEFLKHNSKLQNTKEKNYNFDYIGQNFWLLRETIEDEEISHKLKIFVTHIADKGLVYRK